MGRRILAMLSLGLVLTACGRVNEDLTNQEPYKQIIGDRYRTEMEYVVFSTKDNKETNIIRELNRIFPSKEKIIPPFPIRYQGMLIHGILPLGSELKVVSVKQEGSTGMNFTRVYLEVTKSSDPLMVGKVLYPSGMTDYDNANPVPKFKAEYVEEIRQQKN